MQNLRTARLKFIFSLRHKGFYGNNGNFARKIVKITFFKYLSSIKIKRLKSRVRNKCIELPSNMPAQNRVRRNKMVCHSSLFSLCMAFS